MSLDRRDATASVCPSSSAVRLVLPDRPREARASPPRVHALARPAPNQVIAPASLAQAAGRLGLEGENARDRYVLVEGVHAGGLEPTDASRERGNAWLVAFSVLGGNNATDSASAPFHPGTRRRREVDRELAGTVVDVVTVGDPRDRMGIVVPLGNSTRHRIQKLDPPVLLVVLPLTEIGVQNPELAFVGFEHLPCLCKHRRGADLVSRSPLGDRAFFSRGQRQGLGDETSRLGESLAPYEPRFVQHATFERPQRSLLLHQLPRPAGDRQLLRPLFGRRLLGLGIWGRNDATHQEEWYCQDSDGSHEKTDKHSAPGARRAWLARLCGLPVPPREIRALIGGLDMRAVSLIVVAPLVMGAAGCVDEPGWGVIDATGEPWRSGDRLRAVIWEANGGAATRVGWLDTETGHRCEFVRGRDPERFTCSRGKIADDGDVSGSAVPYRTQDRLGVYRVEMEDGSFQDLSLFDPEQEVRCDPTWKNGNIVDKCRATSQGFVIYLDASCKRRGMYGPNNVSDFVTATGDDGKRFKYGDSSGSPGYDMFGDAGCIPIAVGGVDIYQLGPEVQGDLVLALTFVGDGELVLPVAGNEEGERLADGDWRLRSDPPHPCRPYVLPDGTRQCLDLEEIDYWSDPSPPTDMWLDPACTQPIYRSYQAALKFVVAIDPDDHERLTSVRSVELLDAVEYYGTNAVDPAACDPMGMVSGMIRLGDEVDPAYPVLTEYVE